jgi:thiosulfate/3-mercaptopyruvate sulfurtransferase
MLFVYNKGTGRLIGRPVGAKEQTMNATDRGYANPGVLVSTDWVAQHLDDPNVRIIESNEDPLLYTSGHLPGAVEVDWTADLNDPLRRDYLRKDGFEALMGRIGVTPETQLVFYGDKNNWWATYAFWVFQLFGHTRAAVMDGGRIKWTQEGRPLTRDVAEYPPARYEAPERDDRLYRAFRDQVLDHVKAGGRLVDVRSPAEYSGERLHMPDYPNEGALRGGHIPGAANVPWARAIDAADGTFRSADELRAIYEGEQGLSPDDEVIVYCRIGERSSHTWFVLHYLLGYDRVRNYDGSWTEWGNLVGVPIER